MVKKVNSFNYFYYFIAPAIVVKKIKFKIFVEKSSRVFIIVSMIITKKEIDFIKSKKVGEHFTIYADFGITPVNVIREQERAILEGRVVLSLDQKFKDKFCYLADSQGVIKITVFSQITNRFYKLTPTPDWPTISIGSVPMHRRSSPKKDTEAKVNLLKPYGYVLDTCMGLGYTALLAVKKAKKVITFEKDEIVYDLAKLNPLSKEMFLSPNIEIRREDVGVGIKKFKNNCFDCVIHDPPTFKLAVDLFSKDFYREVKRILRERGKFFHYAPLYKVRQGFDFPSKIKSNLKMVGFKSINFSKEAGGILCRK